MFAASKCSGIEVKCCTMVFEGAGATKTSNEHKISIYMTFNRNALAMREEAIGTQFDEDGLVECRASECNSRVLLCRSSSAKEGPSSEL